jgi:hypothetical protein
MKTIFERSLKMRSKLLFLVVLILATATVHANLVVNHSFEEGTWTSVDDTPQGWTIWEAGGGSVSWYDDAAGAHDGSRYMGIVGGTWPGMFPESGNNLPCTPGQTWYVGGYIKGSTSDICNFLTGFEGADGIFNTFNPPSETEWTYVETEVVVPAGATMTGLTLAGLYGSSEVFFDSVYYDTVPGPPGGRGVVNIYPPDEEEYVPITAVLQWDRPLSYDPNAYDVYLTTDPNANKPEHLVVDGELVTTYDPSPDLEYDTTYYWRVNAYDANCTENCEWPVEGRVWSFTTMTEEPYFTTNTEHTLVSVGGSAVFGVVSPNANLGFEWFREPATLLSHGGDISIVTDATSSTLTISNVEVADEDFYYCVAKNDNQAPYLATESTHAKLVTPKLLAHWELDGPLVSNQYVDETGDHDADPNKPSMVGFTSGIIGNAVEMNNYRWANAGNWRPNEYSSQMTVSAWIKVPDTNDITGDGQGIVSKRVDDSLDWSLYVRNGDGSHPDDNYVRFSSWDGGDAWGSLDDVGEEWAYVTATVDGAGAARIYVNGTVQAVADDFEFGDNEDADILIGKGTPTDYVFPGLIDDVQIYNYARDGYQIATDYTDVAGGSVCAENFPFDYNNDCKVGLDDVAEFALIWRNCNIIPPEDCLLIP